MFSYNPTFEPDDILVYLRKSRSDDPTLTVEEVLQKHEAMLDDWCIKHLNSKIPEENKYREVVSGETIADRPEIQKVLKLIESPKYKAIMIVEIQRLSRGDLEDAGRLIKLLRYTNTQVITPMKTYDLQNDFDREFFERELKRGNEFLEYTKKIMNNGRLLSVSQGNFIGNVAPYGYDKTFVMDGKRKCPTLKINEKQAEIVRLIYDLYVNKDMGVNNIGKHLDNIGVKPLHKEHWSAESLRSILTNVHYIGKVRWNKRKTVTVVDKGEFVKMNPRTPIDEQLIYDGKHEAIISEELYYSAQEKHGRNTRARPNTKIRNPLAGLLYCQCGRTMSLRTYSISDGTERCTPRLICDDQTHCRTGSCVFPELIDNVIDFLQKAIKDAEIQLQDNSAESRSVYEHQLHDLQNQLKALEAKELAQWEAQADPNPDNRMPQEIFKQLNAKLQQEKLETQQSIERLRSMKSKPVEYENKIKKLKDALEALQDPKCEAEKQNRLLKACIDRIDYSRDKPERLKREKGEKKGTRFKTAGGRWSNPPIKLKISLRV